MVCFRSANVVENSISQDPACLSSFQISFSVVWCSITVVQKKPIKDGYIVSKMINNSIHPVIRNTKNLVSPPTLVTFGGAKLREQPFQEK